MEFQNQPFQDLKARVQELEAFAAAAGLRIQYLEDDRDRVATEEPEKVCEKQDDAGGKSLFKAVEEIQEAHESTG